MGRPITLSAMPELAPDWTVDKWFNTPRDLTIEDFRGRVLVVYAFQMLCPGCVSHGLPQMQQLREVFPSDEVAIVGLHTVFEHHAAMTPVSLEAFLHEYRVSFPVGVDRAGTAGPIPETMARYGLRGTPSLLIIDRAGQLRQHAFGRVSDLALGATLATLLAEPSPESCTGDACAIQTSTG